MHLLCTDAISFSGFVVFVQARTAQRGGNLRPGYSISPARLNSRLLSDARRYFQRVLSAPQPIGQNPRHVGFHSGTEVLHFLKGASANQNQSAAVRLTQEDCRYAFLSGSVHC